MCSDLALESRGSEPYERDPPSEAIHHMEDVRLNSGLWELATDRAA
jgi:hypothetical protein